MPFHKKYSFKDINIYTWHITESIDTLKYLAQLSETEIDKFNSFRSDTRKKEWCAVRALLHLNIAPDSTIGYKSSGAPMLRNYPIKKENIVLAHNNELPINLSDSEHCNELTYVQTCNNPEKPLDSKTSNNIVTNNVTSLKINIDSTPPLITHISISHSYEFVAIATCSMVCGVDIELTTRNFERASRRFVNDYENILLSQLPYNINKSLSIIWSIKEAIFKCMGVEDVDFKKDIEIYELKDGIVKYSFRKETPQMGSYFFEGNYVIASV